MFFIFTSIIRSVIFWQIFRLFHGQNEAISDYHVHRFNRIIFVVLHSLSKVHQVFYWWVVDKDLQLVSTWNKGKNVETKSASWKDKQTDCLTDKHRQTDRQTQKGRQTDKRKTQFRVCETGLVLSLNSVLLFKSIESLDSPWKQHRESTTVFCYSITIESNGRQNMNVC